jgi:hypothetical protein
VEASFVFFAQIRRFGANQLNDPSSPADEAGCKLECERSDPPPNRLGAAATLHEISATMQKANQMYPIIGKE